MTTTYQRFRPARPLEFYLGKSGNEVEGLALPPMALEAIAASRTSRIPCELEVIGEWRHDDGRVHLDLGVTTAYIEAVTDFKLDEDAGRLRLVCPDCGLKDGKHTKGCDR